MAKSNPMPQVVESAQVPASKTVGQSRKAPSVKRRAKIITALVALVAAIGATLHLVSLVHSSERDLKKDEVNLDEEASRLNSHWQLIKNTIAVLPKPLRFQDAWMNRIVELVIVGYDLQYRRAIQKLEAFQKKQEKQDNLQSVEVKQAICEIYSELIVDSLQHKRSIYELLRPEPKETGASEETKPTKDANTTKGEISLQIWPLDTQATSRYQLLCINLD